MTVKDDLEGVVAEALSHFDDKGPEDAGTWFLAEFRQKSGVPELVNDGSLYDILFAAARGREVFEQGMHSMVNRALHQQPLAS